MSYERTNYAVIEDTGKDCTKTHCAAYSLAIKQVRCDGCEREVCGSCAIKLGGDVYCPACAVCGYCADMMRPDCGSLAVAWCSDCGLRLCEHHSAKLPDADLCIDCASDRLEAMIHQDEIQLEIYREIEAQS